MVDVCDGQIAFRDLAKAQDALGWRRFLEGMVTKKLVEAQELYQRCAGSVLPIEKWASGLVIKLLECTHGQWLYRNVIVHDAMAGTIATARKEELQTEIEEQRDLGKEGLREEDEYLMEINLDDLEHSSGETQQYWLLAIRAARLAQQLTTAEFEGG